MIGKTNNKYSDLDFHFDFSKKLVEWLNNNPTKTVNSSTFLKVEDFL